MRYASEVEVRDAHWGFLTGYTQEGTRPEARVDAVRHGFARSAELPDLAMFSRVAMEDVAAGRDATLSSNARSMEMVHEVHLARLELLRGELGRKDLGADDRLLLVNEVRDVHVRTLAKDTENKKFQSE